VTKGKGDVVSGVTIKKIWRKKEDENSGWTMTEGGIGSNQEERGKAVKWGRAVSLKTHGTPY